jgi:hypothetical protein
MTIFFRDEAGGSRALRNATPRKTGPTGRDAADVAITTSFGMAELAKSSAVTNEVPDFAPPRGLRSYAVGSGWF